MKTLSWEPVRKGKKYCSPACGHGCTHAAYQIAQKKGAQLAARLGLDWRHEVIENFGWYYRALHVNASCSVLEINSRSFYANLTLGNRQFLCDGTTPNAAVKKALNEAKLLVLNLTHEIEELEK